MDIVFWLLGFTLLGWGLYDLRDGSVKQDARLRRHGIISTVIGALLLLSMLGAP